MTWDDVCAIALDLPLTTLGSYHGYPCLRVGTRFLARLGDDHASVEFKSFEAAERAMLLETEPRIFFRPDGFHGDGVFARLGTLDEATLRRLLDERWRRVAPRSAVSRHDTAAQRDR